jgi:hypothetical protein
MPVTEADLQSAQLGFRADLDGPLCVIAVAGWRTYLQEETTALPMQLWLAQMILNFSGRQFFHAASHSVRPRNYPDPFGRHRRLHLGAMA